MNAERAIKCLLAIQRGEPVSYPWMTEQFGISKAQAIRDMLELERLLPVRREIRERRGFRGIVHHAVLVAL